MLSLGAPGQVRYGGWDMISDCPASLQVTAEGALLRVPAGDPFGTIRTVRLPGLAGQWQLAPGTEGATLVPPMPGNPWLLQFERGATEARLIKQ